MAPEPSPADRDSARVQIATWLLIGSAAGALALILGLAPAEREGVGRSDEPRRTLAPEPEPHVLPAAAPAAYFPCTSCHPSGAPVQRARRALEEEHDDIALAHGDLWCLSCHSADQRDALALAGGETIAFEESWRLCGQCHGEQRAAWQAGAHGKRSGHWFGAKDVIACTTCHDPHQPRFKALAPLPPPRRPAGRPTS